MYICGRTQPLSELGMVGSLRRIKEMGFEGVEICPETKEWGLFEFTADAVREIADLLEELRFGTVSFGLHSNYIDDDDRFELSKRLIEVAPKLSSDVFIISGRRATDDRDEWKKMADRTREFVRVGEANGVRIAMEHEPKFVVGTTADQLRLMQEIDSPFFGANLDIGHAYLVDPDPLESIRAFGDRLFHMHIENMPAEEHRHLPPYDENGVVDLEAVFRTVYETGFSGGMALDLYVDNYEEMARKSLKYLKGIVEPIR